MPFRRRLALAAAAPVASAVLLASAAAYVLVRGQLRAEVDDSLEKRAAAISAVPGMVPDRPMHERHGPPPGGGLGGPVPYVQRIGESGEVLGHGGPFGRLPVDAGDLRRARGDKGATLRDDVVRGDHVRILTMPLPDGGAIQIARSLDEVDQVLGDLRLILAGVLLLGIGFALVLGRFVASTALGPVERLTEASEHVAATRDLSRPINAGKRDDELARLATSFNTMLDALQGAMTALDTSLHAQRQLVAGASHELRTPLTSLRTNIEVLRDPDGLTPEQRRELLDDVATQLDERHVRFETRLEPRAVEGSPERLERAVANLLDNAAKFGPPGSVVEVVLERGELSVRDHGRGIAPVDRPHVFDRFYRAAAARAVPGSGLGLAIVRQTAEAHGGSVRVHPAEGGGTVFRLRLPAQPVAVLTGSSS